MTRWLCLPRNTWDGSWDGLWLQAKGCSTNAVCKVLCMSALRLKMWSINRLWYRPQFSTACCASEDPRTINNRRAIVVLHRTHKNSNMVVTSHDGPLQNTTILELFISQSVPATKWAEQPREQLPKDLQPAFNTQPFLWEQLPCLRPESTLQQCC